MKVATQIERVGFLAPGLCLFGNNAYANNQTMSIPFKTVGSGPKDAFNYFHLQVCINIECAFGILAQSFGLLRSAMPPSFTINKICSLVQAMCKLHNFCIDNDGEEVPTSTGLDKASIATKEGFGLPQLIGGGEHRDDHNHCRGS